MIRSRGSVPEYRTSSRPRPPSRASTRATAAATAGTAVQSRFSRTRTLTSTCGKVVYPAASAASGWPVSAMARRTLSAVTSPSPVNSVSMKMTWPDCSPPRA